MSGPTHRAPVSRVSGIVLAGGRSSRFGTDKLEADFGGRPVLAVTVAAVRPAVSEIVIVGPPAHRTTLDRMASEPGVRIISDASPFAGPLAGLLAGLVGASHEIALVVGGDMPLLRHPVLAQLCARLVGVGLDAVTLEATPPQPMPLAVRRMAALRATEELLDRGERSLRALLAALRWDSIPEDEWRRLDPSGDSLVDVDRPVDLARALERLDGRSSDLEESAPAALSRSRPAPPCSARARGSARSPRRGCRTS